MKPFQSTDRRRARDARSPRRAIALVLMSLAAAILLPGAAAAAAAGPSVIVKVHQASRVVSPYFQLTAAPGRRVRAGSLELVNPRGRSETVELDPVDAITTDTLGSAYALANAGRHGPATWLRLSRRTVSLAAHARKTVTVSLAVSNDARPGDYLSGVSVEALGQPRSATVGKGVAIGEIDRYAIGIEVRLPGARKPSVALTGAGVTREPAGLAFLLHATNKGNVILKDVHGWMRVTRGKRLVAATAITPGTFVSGTTISYPLRAQREQPAAGTSYRVRAAMYYAGRVARLDKQVVFSHAAAVAQQNYGGRKLPHAQPPWRWLFAGLAATIGLAGGGIVLRRHRRPLRRNAGVRLLERSLSNSASYPLSIALVRAGDRASRTLPAVIRPRLRRADRLCDFGSDGLLVVCPGTGARAAVRLRDDLREQLTRHAPQAGSSVEIALATATDSVSATALLARIPSRTPHEDEPLETMDGELATR
jgi:hypothetical protein